MAAPLAHALGPFRARARRVVFIRAALVMLSIAFALTLLWTLWWPSSSRWTIAYLLSLIAGVIVTFIYTHRRTPTLAATAALIDARLHFQNHVGAAWQVAHETGPIAALVVRSALNRLRDAAPAQVFPLDAGRHALAATIIGSAALVVLAADRGPSNPSSTVASSPTAAMAGAQLAGTSAENPTPSPAGAAKSAPLASRPADGGISAAAADKGTDSPTTPRLASAIDPAEPETRGSTVPSSEAGIPRADSQVAGRQAPSGPGNPAAAGSTGRQGESAGATTAAKATAGQPSAGTGGSDRDSGRDSGRDSRAGGVAAGSLRAGVMTGRVPAPPPLASPNSASAAAAARAQAAAALTRDDIPPGRRLYVRDYFLRLNAQGGRP